MQIVENSEKPYATAFFGNGQVWKSGGKTYLKNVGNFCREIFSPRRKFLLFKKMLKSAAPKVESYGKNGYKMWTNFRVFHNFSTALFAIFSSN